MGRGPTFTEGDLLACLFRHQVAQPTEQGETTPAVAALGRETGTRPLQSLSPPNLSGTTLTGGRLLALSTPGIWGGGVSWEEGALLCLAGCGAALPASAHHMPAATQLQMSADVATRPLGPNSTPGEGC